MWSGGSESHNFCNNTAATESRGKKDPEPSHSFNNKTVITAKKLEFLSSCSNVFLYELPHVL